MTSLIVRMMNAISALSKKCRSISPNNSIASTECISDRKAWRKSIMIGQGDDL